MIVNLSNRLAYFFAQNKIIEKEDIPIYGYGLELVLSSFVNGVIALLIAILTKTFFACFFYLIAFIIMRSSGGGFHAKTHLGCCIISAFVLCMFVTYIKICPTSLYTITSVTSMIVTFPTLLLFAPLEHENKPLTDTERKRLRQVCLTEMFISFSFIAILNFINKRIMVSIALGLFTSSCSILTAKIFYTVNYILEQKNDILGQKH